MTEPIVQYTFNERPDGIVEVRLGEEWPLFNDALADSVSSLPPRGQKVLGPSTYWIDVALAGLEQALAEDSVRPFTWGNITQLRVRDGMVEARFDFDDEDVPGERMPIEDFREILREWRVLVEVSASQASVPLPETYRRNPTPDFSPHSE
jgi:hypothetical protein